MAGSASAADVFVAGFERRGGRLQHGVRIVGAFIGALFQGLAALDAEDFLAEWSPRG